MKSKKDRSQFTIDISQGTTHITPGHTTGKPKQNSVSWLLLASAGQIGFAILIPLLLGVAGGIFFDQRLGTKPAGVLGGLVIGIILSIINLIMTVKGIIKNQITY